MKRHDAKGVTLIELIIVIMIVGILTTVSSLYIKETIDLWRFLTFRSEVTAQGRLALLRMARELRQLRDASSVVTANISQLRFYDMSGSDINYGLSGNNLVRNSDVLASGADGLTFTYYDQFNTIINNPDVSPQQTNIYRIDIRLDMRAGTQAKTLKTQVYPRNL